MKYDLQQKITQVTILNPSSKQHIDTHAEADENEYTKPSKNKGNITACL